LVIGDAVLVAGFSWSSHDLDILVLTRVNKVDFAWTIVVIHSVAKKIQHCAPSASSVKVKRHPISERFLFLFDLFLKPQYASRIAIIVTRAQNSPAPLRISLIFHEGD